ncbi:MAG: deoxyribonuclease IV [Ardenticatenales bacterium]|nr:deoxyribonuclease IV [Ardenticatenales bacterium]
MPLIGAHCSTAGGLWTAFDRGEQLGCEAIQLFTKSNRRWQAPALKEEEIARFRQRAAETALPVVAHASYLINLASPDDGIWHKSLAGYFDEMDRCRALGIPYLVMHPGAHTGSGYEAGIARVADAINREHARGDDSTMLLLEITAGTGTSLGFELEHFADILVQLSEPDRIGICFDTCHALGAGWEINTRQGYEAVMKAFDERVGLHRIRCFHLNDSQHVLGSRRDRHTHLGRGHCTLETFRHILNDPRFAGLPMLLETPKNDDMAQDVVNLKVLRALLDGCAEPVTLETLDSFWEGVDPIDGKDE